MLAMLSMLKAEVGQTDAEMYPALFICAFISFVFLWGLGYAIGSMHRAELLGGAAGLGLGLCILCIPAALKVWQILVSLAVWVQLWSTIGYAIGKRYSMATRLGIWGGLLGPLSMLPIYLELRLRIRRPH
jgi:hypothetical protein